MQQPTSNIHYMKLWDAPFNSIKMVVKLLR